MMVAEIMTDGNDGHDHVLDLSVNKKTISNNEIVLKQNQNLSLLLSPPSSSSSSSSSSLSNVNSTKQTIKSQKRALEPSRLTTTTVKNSSSTTSTSNKRPLRFQCKHCDYKAPSTSLMQNHIYRHTDLTPYACAYCGHKSTTKSTIMVHIELCHPNMEVKILENRVREQDFYRDLNSNDIETIPNHVEEPQTKKVRHSNQYDSDSAPINGVAISLKNLVDDGNESSSTNDETSETENLEPILFDEFPSEANNDNNNEDENDINDNHRSDLLIDLSANDSLPTMVKPMLKLQVPSKPMTNIEQSSSTKKDSDSDDGSEYLLVYNRPKQYYGSLYEPDKQYACKLCSYTTNHRPSMEDHVFVHTNEKPYKCGYCGEEIYTRYAATYHIKYKHAGMARNFIQNKADVTQYYVNRAKKEDEKNQFKVIDTRRVKIPMRNGKSIMSGGSKLSEVQSERTNCSVSKSSPPSCSPLPSMAAPTITNNPSNSQSPSNNGTPDYRVLFAWSYYLASQAAWLSPMFQQGQGQGQISPNSLPTDPQAIEKYLQTMQNNAETANNFNSILKNSDSNEKKSKSNDPILFDIKKEDE